MALKYVLKNFRRRKVRTLLMLLSLLVSTGLIVALNATVETIRRSNIDLIASETGRYDFTITKTDIDADPFINLETVTPLVRDTELDGRPIIDQVQPRFQSVVELEANGEVGSGWLLALDPETDTIGQVEVISGTYDLGPGRVALLEDTADTYDLALGDTIQVAYSLPLPREEGRPGAAGSSLRRALAQFTVVAVVRQQGVTTDGVSEGLIIDLASLQQWLGLSGRAERLLVVVDPILYETRDAEQAALSVRAVAENVQAALGEGYTYSLDKPGALDMVAQAFVMIQALINIYGLTALGIVGLLVHTLVMTNVQEQRREMAILRILGAQRNVLFSMVLTEVAVIGAIGVGLGVFLGQLINQYIIVPIIISQLENGVALQPQIGFSAIWPAVLSALVVLFFSALKPAQDAASTKVMHAINPGVADNIQIEDLAQLRERKPSGKLFFIGLVMTLVFVLIFFGFQYIFSFGGPSMQAALIFGAFFLMVLGVGLMFFITTVPFERIIMVLSSLVAPRLAFFARRNVGRGQTRNTLISLMVLFSGVLPSFLATQVALNAANLETDVRLQMGGPVRLQVSTGSDPQLAPLRYMRPSFMENELEAIPGIDASVGLSYGYSTQISDLVGLRQGRVTVYGVSGRLREVLYPQLIAFSDGSAASLDELLVDPAAVIISEGLAEHLAVSAGETIRLTGMGLDHEMEVRVAGVVRRLPGFSNMGRSRNDAQWGSSDLLISLEGFRQLTNDPLYPLPPADDPTLIRFLATLEPGADGQQVAGELRNRFGLKYSMRSQLAEVQIESARESENQQRVFLLILTGISFTTAVFGVFAVIYVTIYARRLEIGMMKAVGARGWELTGTLVLESIAMTLSAGLAGIVAGAAMGYLFVFGNNLISQRPTIFAIDVTVTPFVVVMIVIASVISAVFSTRRIIRQRAIEILRML